MEIKQHNTYIFKYQKAAHRVPFKAIVKEVTDTTYLIENLDTEIIFRTDKDSFDNDYKAVELIEDWNKVLEDAIKNMGTGSLEVVDLHTFQDFTHPCYNKACYCDGSCQKVYGPNTVVGHNLLAGPGSNAYKKG